MPTYGLKIAQKDKSAETSNTRQLGFDSRFKTLKVFKKGTASQSGNSGDTLTFTIPHLLPFIPFALVYYNSSLFPTYWEIFPYAGGNNFITANGDIFFNFDIDETNVTFALRIQNGAAETITIKYIIFYEPLNKI